MWFRQRWDGNTRSKFGIVSCQSDLNSTTGTVTQAFSPYLYKETSARSNKTGSTETSSKPHCLPVLWLMGVNLSIYSQSVYTLHDQVSEGLNQLSDGPKLNRRFLLVKCIPMIGVSFVQKVAIKISLVSVRTEGLWVTLTSSRELSLTNFWKFHNEMLPSMEAEASMLFSRLKDSIEIMAVWDA